MASTCNHVLIAGELKQCIEERDLDRFLYYTVRYKNADKLKIAEDYLTLTKQMLIDDIMCISSKDVGEMLANSWKYYLNVKATFIRDAFKGKATRRGIDLSLMSSPDEWIDLRKAYASLYKEDMEHVIKKACPPNTITTRILIAWIAYRRTPRNNIMDDITSLYAAATGEKQTVEDQSNVTTGKKTKKGSKKGQNSDPNWDFILKMLGTSTPQEWSRICSGFEKRYSLSLCSILKQHMNLLDYNAFEVASNVLCDIVQGIACLLHIYVNTKDATGIMGLVSMYCDKCNNLRLEYQKFGDLRSDLARVLSPTALHACLTLLQVPE